MTNWLVSRHAEIMSVTAMVGAVGALAAAAGLIVAANQLSEGRKVLEAQALSAALQNSRAILTGVQSDPALMAGLAGANPTDIARSAFINRVVSMFSEQLILSEMNILPKNYWDNFRPDLCDFVTLSTVQKQIESNIERDTYPQAFVKELEACFAG